MYLARNIDTELLHWKGLSSRKPLLLRGARQVGKSTVVRQLAQHFEYFAEINFDENPDYAKIFENSLSPQEICQQIAVLTNTPIQEGKTLLFLDEIQSCTEAIGSIRYFYEKMPDLHLIAAGSLLEFALAEIPSFGVGRIRSMFLYPLSFSEFLRAKDETLLLEMMSTASASKPIPELIHQKLLKTLRTFMTIGGMPEVVKSYVQQGDLLEVQRILNDLLLSMQDDFAKYKANVAPARIKEVFDAVALQMGTKFTYTYPNSTLNNKQIKEALELLTMAGIIYPVTHSSANGIPLGAEINPKKRKFLLYDTGIFQRLLDLNISEILLEDTLNAINKGNIAELYAGLELLKMNSPYEKTALYYWHREAKSSQAEVDYVIQLDNKIVPLEVKSGTKGSMKSMRVFLAEKGLDQGIRLSLENYSEYENIESKPLYAFPLDTE